MGGMGNQMFQYAFGRCLAERYDTDLKMDLRFLHDRTPRPGFVFRDYDLSIFNIKENFANENEIFYLKNRFSSQLIEKITNKILGRKSSYLLESNLNFDSNYFNTPDNSYLEGYFQSENYFKPIEKKIREEFSFKNPIQNHSVDILNQIQSTNSICVNIRRADFVTNDFHGTCGVNYYHQAEEIIESKIENPVYYIFSDDMDWCRENIYFKNEFHFVGHIHKGDKFQDYLRLMSACKDFIIPNSSFAWWAAYLSKNENKIVVAPKRWNSSTEFDTTSLTLPNWILI